MKNEGRLVQLPMFAVWRMEEAKSGTSRREKKSRKSSYGKFKIQLPPSSTLMMAECQKMKLLLCDAEVTI